jgi:hypothetical protein
MMLLEKAVRYLAGARIASIVIPMLSRHTLALSGEFGMP